MNWTDLKNKIYYWDGSWRDIYVLQTNRDDWKKWADYVNKHYRIDWFNGKVDKEVILTPENEHETILFKVKSDKIEFSENIDPTNWKLRTR